MFYPLWKICYLPHLKGGSLTARITILHERRHILLYWKLNFITNRYLKYQTNEKILYLLLQTLCVMKELYITQEMSLKWPSDPLIDWHCASDNWASWPLMGWSLGSLKYWWLYLYAPWVHLAIHIFLPTITNDCLQVCCVKDENTTKIIMHSYR